MGKFRPKANVPPLKAGRYAAHCGGGNSYNVGVALCGMLGYLSPRTPGKYPITRKSFEAACKLIAELSMDFGVEITSETVFSHYEFGKRNPKTSSGGKIDIVFLPWEPKLKPNEIGEYIRAKGRWYRSHL